MGRRRRCGRGGRGIGSRAGQACDGDRLGRAEAVLDRGQLRVVEHVAAHLLHLEDQEQQVLVDAARDVEAHVGLAPLHQHEDRHEQERRQQQRGQQRVRRGRDGEEGVDGRDAFESISGQLVACLALLADAARRVGCVVEDVAVPDGLEAGEAVVGVSVAILALLALAERKSGV